MRSFSFSFPITVPTALRTALAVAIVASLSACDSKPADKTADGRPVLTAKVQFASQVPDRSFVGTVQPRVESGLGFRISGKVEKRLVDVGTRVEPGQPLATLDEIDLKLQLEQAEAELRAATGVLEQAKGAEDRTNELRNKGWSTNAQIEQSKAAADEARARLNRAQRAVELARNGRSYATLVSDAQGVVTATSIEPGQVVTAGQPAIRVARFGEKEIAAAIPETLVAWVRTGNAKATLWSDQKRSYTAKLRELSPSADPSTRTYMAKFTLTDAGEEAQLGMSATLTVSDNDDRRVAKLPLSALFNQGAGPAVYVVDPKTGAISLRPVTVESYRTQDVLISSGVDDGAEVVALGVHKLDPSQKVRIVSALSF